MEKAEIKCIHCGSNKVVKAGKQKYNGAPRCRCRSCSKYFQLEYVSSGASPVTKTLIKKMLLNGSSIRYISRELGVHRNTVSSVFKKTRERLIEETESR